MNNQVAAKSIVLARTNFQEADRIITVLTPDYGKVRLIAKGVRRERSKLAGGIELLSVNSITFLPGRKEIGTLVSSRLKMHFDQIIKDISRTMLGYDMLKRMNRLTEDAAGEEYYRLLEAALSGLNNPRLSIELAELWFTMQLLKVTGHSPNLRSDISGQPLQEDKKHQFNYDAMAFQPRADGSFTASHIKLLRLCIGASSPEKLEKVEGADRLSNQALKLAVSMLQRLVRI